MERLFIFKMKMSSKKFLIIDLIEQGLKDNSVYFTEEEYSNWVKKLPEKDVQIAHYFRNNCFNNWSETKHGIKTHYLRLKPEFYFNYIDHLELIEARKNAKEARYFALIAIIISVLAIVIGVFMPLDLKESTVKSIGKAVAENVRLAE